MSTSSLAAAGLSELLKRLSPEEKREFAQLVNWEEFRALSNRVSTPTHVRTDPELYVGTTSDGMSFEIPVQHISGFLRVLCTLLVPESIAIFVQSDEGPDQRSCSTCEEFERLSERFDLSADIGAMIEFDAHSLVTGGGGCFSLTLEDSALALRRTIAEQVLSLCGFEYRFQSDEFAAIVRDGELEVDEWTRT